MFNGEEISLINKGVIQGGTLSPTLFTVFINDLIDKLEKLDLYVFAYADDIAILGKGNKNLDIVWETIWRWSYDNGMEINRKKSGIIVHKGFLKK